MSGRAAQFNFRKASRIEHYEVNGICHQFFSGAAFPADENGDIGVRNPSNHLKDFRHLLLVPKML